MGIQQMHIQEVLSEIRSSTGSTQPFLLQVVKSRGRSRGVIRTYGQCLKGFPSGPAREKSDTGTTRGKFLYKEHDTIPIIDLEDDHKLRTLPISHIIGYNQYKVIH